MSRFLVLFGLAPRDEARREDDPSHANIHEARSIGLCLCIFTREGWEVYCQYTEASVEHQPPPEERNIGPPQLPQGLYTALQLLVHQRDVRREDMGSDREDGKDEEEPEESCRWDEASTYGHKGEQDDQGLIEYHTGCIPCA